MSLSYSYYNLPMNCNDKSGNLVSAYSFPIVSKLSTKSKDSKCREKNMQQFVVFTKSSKKQNSIFRKGVIFITPTVVIHLHKRRTPH